MHDSPSTPADLRLRAASVQADDPALAHRLRAMAARRSVPNAPTGPVATGRLAADGELVYEWNAARDSAFFARVS